MEPKTQEILRDTARILLGSFLITAGVGHLSFARKEFKAQVPDFVPLKKDDTVVYSGYAEILLGAALIAAPKKIRPGVGKITAGFFAAVFPGNISQYMHHRNMPGLDTDKKRFVRLFFQPLLMFWAVKSTSNTN